MRRKIAGGHPGSRAHVPLGPSATALGGGGDDGRSTSGLLSSPEGSEASVPPPAFAEGK